MLCLTMLAACYTRFMRPIFAVLSLIAFWGFTPPGVWLLSRPLLAASEPHSGSTLLHRFEEKYRHATRLQCNFLQRYSEDGRLARTEAGEVYFLHPGKMRWDYQAPEKNTFLVDGKYVWFYAPADHTATRTLTKNSQDWRTPLAFLTGELSLSRLCSKIDAVTDPPPFAPGNSVFRCLLGGKGGGDPGGVRTVYFDLTPAGDLSRIRIPEEGGIEHEFIFKNWQWNVPVPKDWFVFVPPEGVVIVNGLLPTPSVSRQ